MSFVEPTRRDPRLSKGRQGGLYEEQANTADRQWAIRCGLSLRKSAKKAVHLKSFSLRTWRREEADAAARVHSVIIIQVIMAYTYSVLLTTE